MKGLLMIRGWDSKSNVIAPVGDNIATIIGNTALICVRWKPTYHIVAIGDEADNILQAWKRFVSDFNTTKSGKSKWADLHYPPWESFKIWFGNPGISEKPVLQINHGGNAFDVLARARKVALESGMDWDLIDKEARNGDYDHLLVIMQKYFDIIER